MKKVKRERERERERRGLGKFHSWCDEEEVTNFLKHQVKLVIKNQLY